MLILEKQKGQSEITAVEQKNNRRVRSAIAP
jgi:hypothetical protein